MELDALRLSHREPRQIRMTVDFINNSNQRTPCVLILDASGSMNQQTSTGRTRIEELNAGIGELEFALSSDPVAISRVQLCIVVVGGPSNSAELMLDWTDASDFHAFPIRATGGTPLGEALEIGLEMAEMAKRNLRKAGISYTRPWMMVISDGTPTSAQRDWDEAVEKTRTAERERKVEIFSIGVEGADLEKLSQISHRSPIQLSGMKFKELFVWLSDSLSAVAQSRPGDNLNLPDTDPWKHVGI
jgi:uncharacterized protein YegL